jgi:hypothetical protein
MFNRDKLPKISDVDRESQYGYVYGVSGPGKNRQISVFRLINSSFYFSRYS